MKGNIILIIIGTISLVSCSKDMTHEPIPVNCLDTISYSLQIQPLLDINCSTSGCHDASSGQGGFILMTHSEVSSASSDVYAAMNHSGPNPMPLGGAKLADSLIKQFECWIEQGTQNN